MAYAIGKLKKDRNQKNAVRYLAYLLTDNAQNIYTKHGYLKAGVDFFKLKVFRILSQHLMQ